ncbi:MAG: EamA/RhaT family transporter [Mesorhizobium amorphae]|nr:MAG: EamA/RhaT family transporter [Mesorhizobium amorphae]
MQSQNLKAFAALTLGVCVFSIQDVIIKELAGRYPITQAMTVRSVVALPLLLGLVVWTAGGLRSIFARDLGWLALRALVFFVSYLCYYLALAALPIADAVALYFTAPLIISGLAVVLLGERLRWHTAVALLAGFAGVLVMLDPGEGVFQWTGLLVVVGAGLYGASQIITRRIGSGVPAAVMTFHQNLALLFGAPLLTMTFAALGIREAAHPSLEFLVRPWVWPTPVDFAMMASCGVIAGVAMTLLSQAYRMAPAARVSVFEYTAILWGPLWGFLFFAEVPRAATWAGAALICGAGLFALGRELRTRELPA